MTNWLEIITFLNPTQANFLKSLLEEEGIKVILKDYQNGLIKNLFLSHIVKNEVNLLVLQTDADKAYQILKDLGYKKEDRFKENKTILSPYEFIKRGTILSSIFNKTKKFIFIFSLALIGLAIIFFSMRPSDKEILVKNTWSINTIKHNEEILQPKISTCNVIIRFNKNGTVDLPGFTTCKISALWKYENKKIHIYDSEQNSDIYNGIYNISINTINGSFSLKSKKQK